MASCQALRPTIPKNTNPKFAELLDKCWQQDPTQRPDFSEIVEILRHLAKEVLSSPTVIFLPFNIFKFHNLETGGKWGWRPTQGQVIFLSTEMGPSLIRDERTPFLYAPSNYWDFTLTSPRVTTYNSRCTVFPSNYTDYKLCSTDSVFLSLTSPLTVANYRSHYRKKL